jgi:hypothetical protein
MYDVEVEDIRLFTLDPEAEASVKPCFSGCRSEAEKFHEKSR